jgi:hypothetical protein
MQQGPCTFLKAPILLRAHHKQYRETGLRNYAFRLMLVAILSCNKNVKIAVVPDMHVNHCRKKPAFHG